MLLALLFVVALAERQLVVRRDIIETVNNANAGWTAGVNERFIGMTVEEAKQLLGLELAGFQAPRDASLDLSVAAPEEFDSRTAWPYCSFPILDQGHCGSCWAFGCAEALGDRFCIHSNGTFKDTLSPQSLVSCDVEGNFGCKGGIPRLAWDYLEVSGIPTLKCYPYLSGQSGETGKCQRKCSDGSEYKAYRVKFLSIHAYKTEAEIQAAIQRDGPIETGFQVYEDFMNYKSGVYSHVTGSLLGGHAVKIVGWGVEGAKKYWAVANSWGTTWGDRGFFKILRGKNECGFEAGGVAGMPAL